MIGIVILNYRNWEETRRCVESIAMHPPDDVYRIILVDNASGNAPDYELRLFLERYHIIFIRNRRNLGYNAGNNVGIARALAVKPRIIFADEPTGNLDSKTTMEVLALMRELDQEPKSAQRKGNAVIYFKQSEKIEDFRRRIYKTGGLLGRGAAEKLLVPQDWDEREIHSAHAGVCHFP